MPEEPAPEVMRIDMTRMASEFTRSLDVIREIPLPEPAPPTPPTTNSEGKPTPPPDFSD